MSEVEGIKEKELVWVDKNLENLPIFYFGKHAEKVMLELVKKKRLIQTKLKTPEGEKFFTLNPSANYGLLQGFDQDVYVAVIKVVNDWSKKLGYCPNKITVPIKELCSIQRISKSGRSFKDITQSLEKFDSTSFAAGNTIFVRTKNRTDEYFNKRSYFLFKVDFKRKKSIYIDKNTGEKKTIIKEYTATITLDEWLRNNIENGFTTDIDIDFYFNEIRGGRTRKLYQTLNFIRYTSPVFIPYDKLIASLSIVSKEMFRIKRDIERATEPLIKSGFLTKTKFGESNVGFFFKQVKRKKRALKIIKSAEELANEKILVMDMLEALGDIKSERFYSKVARLVPKEIIYKCLSLVREVSETSKVKKNRGAVFVDILKRECQQRGIKLFSNSKQENELLLPAVDNFL
ncbi:replication initiator protein A [Patescibacteria group bacterium]|nr:replication initiator protein A [Patescibacteria group bacterium]